MKKRTRWLGVLLCCMVVMLAAGLSILFSSGNKNTSVLQDPSPGATVSPTASTKYANKAGYNVINPTLYYVAWDLDENGDEYFILDEDGNYIPAYAAATYDAESGIYNFENYGGFEIQFTSSGRFDFEFMTESEDVYPCISYRDETELIQWPEPITYDSGDGIYSLSSYDWELTKRETNYYIDVQTNMADPEKKDVTSVWPHKTWKHITLEADAGESLVITNDSDVGFKLGSSTA